MPVVDHLHQIAALLGGEFCHEPIVEDEDAGARQRLEGARLAAMQESLGKQAPDAPTAPENPATPPQP